MCKKAQAKAPPRPSPLATCLGSLFALSGSALAAAPGAGALPQPFHGAAMAGSMATRAPDLFAKAHAARPVARATTAALIASAAVTNCGDDPNDFNNLRHAVLTANPGDTIDLSGLQCSKITLQNGALAVTIADLKIDGPGAAALTIDGNGADRVFMHSGTGTLTLTGITVANGVRSADKAYGGCIYSKGSIALNAATLTSCKALGQTAAVGGGAVAFGTIALEGSVLANNVADAAIGGGSKNTSALGGGAVALSQAADSTLSHSLVTGNTVSSPSGLAEGGGMIAAKLTVKYSTFTGNQAIGAGIPYNYGAAGAFITLYSLSMGNSTVDHNEADIGGAMFLANAGFATILQSTVSGNKGNLGVGGIGASVALSMANSTVAFNSAGAFGGGGVVVTSSYSMSLQSNIIADNTPTDLDGGMTITGNNNLVKVAGANTPALPADTVTLDPQLGPLAYNGGATRTHGLTAGSPAIDAGSNPANLARDQRGSTFGRSIGLLPDIGAVEFDPDHIFTDAFGDP